MDLQSNQRKAIKRLEAQIISCQKCGLCQGRTNAVPGEGSLTADIMFVGEGPGKQEDLEGRPFCGASGKFLDQLLAGIGLAREEVYITNIVKCRPPNNRDPFEDEKTACAPYLEAQIRLIKPLVIATLGRHAMNHFLPNLQISQVHGKPFRKNGQVYVPLYHPAVALYKGSMRGELESDFAAVRKTINKLAKELTQPQLING